jgi:YHS domain-containing protein
MTVPALSRRRFAMVLAAGAAASALRAVPATAGKAAVYTGLLSSTAVGGYDPVAYFKDGRPVEGSAEFTVEHQGATWRFASAANRDAFRAAPDKYAPRYGGYCAWAVSQGYTAKGDPRYWRVVDGKLYLNYSADVQQTWVKDIPGNIAKADTNWPKVLE